MEAHPESLGTVLVIGALALAGTRQLIAWRLQRAHTQWPMLSITLLGIAFAISRLVHLGTDDPDRTLWMIRVQYGICLALPGLGMAALDVMSDRAVSRSAVLALGAGVFVAMLGVATPWLVTGPLHDHADAFGHIHRGAQPSWLALALLPLAVPLVFAIRRRLAQMPHVLGGKRRGFVAGAILFVLAGLHDALMGAGVIASVFVLEYGFVTFGILSATFELRRTAFAYERLQRQLNQKRQTLEERESSLHRTTRRLERSNTRYRHLAGATREGVILCAGVRILDVNDAACRLLGHPGRPARAADLRSADLRTIVVESNRGLLERVLGAEEGPFEVTLSRADNSEIPVSIKSIAAPPGSPGTRVLLVRDVSAERALQRRLATSDRLAAVGTLAAGTAHEINNPLAFVLANADLIDETLDPSDERREMLADIKAGALRIRDVVRDLMTLAREQGRTVATVDLGETLRRSVAMAAPQTKHRARVETSLGAALTVRADEGRLFQVFLNLIVNAAQAIGDGDAAHNLIRVVARREASEVVIEVSDTGSGIPRDVVDRIFEPFFTTKEVGQGTGLGLSISHGIVSELGGRIEVASTVGTGTTFRVYLPASGAVEDADGVPELAELTESGRLRVLVIDDEQALASSLARMLDAHDVDVAHSGRAALERLAQRRYDVAVCDVMMPDVSGIQLFQALRDQNDPIADRFLFMTGGASTSEAQRFLEEIGSARWVAKPISMRDLRRRVRELGGHA